MLVKKECQKKGEGALIIKISIDGWGNHGNQIGGKAREIPVDGGRAVLMTIVGLKH